MNFLKEAFGRKKKILPCDDGGDCPYEYDRASDRDIEGMPFSEGDPRSCPTYGHVCPEFMEDFNLTVEDLNIRATIHCGGLLDQFVKDGTIQKDSPEYTLLHERYKDLLAQYPIDKYPQYY